MNDIKLIVTDMDGTFLNSNKEMHEDSFEVIDKLIDKNICFVVASGRQYFNLYNKFNKRDNIYYISENGAYVVKNKEIIHFTPMDKEFVKKVLIDLDKLKDTYVVLSGRKASYIKVMPENIFENCNEYYHKVEVLENFDNIDDEICKIAILNKNGTQENVYPYIKKYNDEYSVVVSAFEWVDIFDKSVNKGSAIEKIQNILNIKKDEIMGFGDYLNDYELIQVSGESYVMENGHEELKKIAKHIIGTNNEFSVIKTIKEKFKI